MDENAKPMILPPGYTLGPCEPTVEFDPDGPPQFSLGALLGLQVGIAGFLVLLFYLHAWAIIPVLLLTLILRWGPWQVRNAALRRIVFALLAGVGLPVLCLACDPGLLGMDSHPFRIVAFSGIVFQMVAMVSWLVYDTLTGRPSGLLSGMLSVGFLLALTIGLLMLPLSIIGIVLYGLGLLGFTPFLTCYAYGSAARRAWRLGPDRSRWLCGLGFFLGVAIAVGVPLLLNATASDAVGWLLNQMSHWSQARWQGFI